MPRRNHARMPSRARNVVLAGTAALGLAALAAPAQAALSLTGPLNPATNFPAWYQDSNGTQLELCIADAKCPASPTLAEMTNGDGQGEAFYQLASATVTGAGAQSVTADFNVEAAFLDPGAGQEITFGRIQVGMTGMEPNSDYTVTYPYGAGVWHTDAGGAIAGNDRTAQRHEVGCAAVPCNFDEALGTEIGPFMLWDPAESAPDAGYIGDGITPHTIVGPAVTSVTVEGPGLPAGGISTNLFTLEGKLASAPAPIFFSAPGSGSFGTQRVGSTTTRTITVKNNGLAAMANFDTVAISGAGGFIKGTDTCLNTSLASGATCTVQVSFTPSAQGAASASLVLTESGTPHSVSLDGIGALPGLSTSGVVDFLNQPVSSTSNEQALQVTNNGLVPLRVTNLALGGANPGEFAISGNGCGGSVAPGASCTIGLRFLPAQSGTRNATLSISSDAPASPHTVALTGNGTVLPGAGAANATGTTTTVTTTATTGTAPTGTTAKPTLVLKSLATAARIKQSKAKKQGIRLTMGLPSGTEIVKVNVYRKTGTKLTLLSSGFRVTSSAVPFRVSQSQPALRRLLRRGSYAVQVTPGYSKTELGTTKKVSFKVV